MTSLGKFLVFANTFVAVVLFGWAVSLYSNRTDWFDRTIDEVKVDGQITQLQNEVKRLSEMGKTAQQGYAAASARAANEEIVRDYRAYKLNERLQKVRGSDASVRFVEQKREAGKALIDVQADGTVINGLNAQPLKGLGTLRKEYDDLSRMSADSFKKIDQYRDEYKALSAEIDLVQVEVLRQKIIRDNLADEQDYLFDARINWEEQLRNLEFRKTQLEQRIASLNK
jgi:chromosome segregation ATPase